MKTLKNRDALRVLFFGSSIVAPRGELKVAAAWTGEYLGKAGVANTIINAGVAGDSSEMGRARFADEVLARKPDIVIMTFGINDSAIDVWKDVTEPRVSIERYVENLTYMCREMKQHGIRVILFSAPPLYMTKQLHQYYGKEPYLSRGFNFLLDQYLAKMREVAAAQGAAFVDVNRKIRKLAGGDTEKLLDYSLEGMHPNDAGQEIIAQMLFPEIERYLNSESVTYLDSAPGNPRNSEGAFVQLKDDRLMFAYSRYNGDTWHDHASADIAAVHSTDGGRSWTEQPEIIFHHEGHGNLMSLSLLRLRNGRLAATVLRKRFIEEKFCDCRPMIAFSDDEGASWSKLQYCTPIPGYHVVNHDRLIQLKSGRLMLPAALHRWQDDDNCGVSMRATVYIFYSDDDGANWHEAPGWVLPPQESGTGLQEPGLVELNDGTLMAWFRTDLGCQYKAFSHDGGMTWSHAVAAREFPAPPSPLSMKRAPGGELIAIWNDYTPRWAVAPRDGSWGRTPLVLAVSRNEGKSWENHMLLEDRADHGYCYTAMYFTDGALLLAYCCGGGSRTVTLQDLCIRRIENFS